jgi:hypothetical protein
MDTKKLRQKILDLAIRGKLVPQDLILCFKRKWLEVLQTKSVTL